MPRQHLAGMHAGETVACEWELFELHALVRLWARYPWVIAISGPDVLLLPHGALMIFTAVQPVTYFLSAAGSTK